MPVKKKSSRTSNKTAHVLNLITTTAPDLPDEDEQALQATLTAEAEGNTVMVEGQSLPPEQAEFSPPPMASNDPDQEAVPASASKVEVALTDDESLASQIQEALTNQLIADLSKESGSFNPRMIKGQGSGKTAPDASEEVAETPETPVAEETTPDVSEEIQETPEAPVAEETTPDVSEEVTESPETPVAEETTPDVSEEVTEAPVAEETTPDVGEEIQEAPVAEEITPDVGEEVAETPEVPVAEETTPDVGEEVTETPEAPVAEETTPDVSEEVAEAPEVPMAEETTPDVSEEVTEAPEVPMAEETTPDVSEEVTEAPEVPLAEETTPDVSEEVTETPEVPVAEETTPDVSEEIQETPEAPMAEETTPDVSEEVTEAPEAPEAPVAEETTPDVSEEIQEAPEAPVAEETTPDVSEEVEAVEEVAEIPEVQESLEAPMAEENEPNVSPAVFPKVSLEPEMGDIQKEDAESEDYAPPTFDESEGDVSLPDPEELAKSLPPRSTGTAPEMPKKEAETPPYLPPMPTVDDLKPLTSASKPPVPPSDILDMIDSKAFDLYNEESALSSQIQDALTDELDDSTPSIFLDPILPPEASNPSSISLAPSVPLELGSMPEKPLDLLPKQATELLDGLEELEPTGKIEVSDHKNPMVGRRLGEPVEYYNLTEILVRDLAPSSLQTFGNCTCDQCLLDVIAHCLSRLPPKYVVRYHGGYDAIYEGYKQEYGSAIVSQLGKSCMFVNESPRHLKAFMSE